MDHVARNPRLGRGRTHTLGTARPKSCDDGSEHDHVADLQLIEGHVFNERHGGGHYRGLHALPVNDGKGATGLAGNEGQREVTEQYQRNWNQIDEVLEILSLASAFRLNLIHLPLTTLDFFGMI